VERLKKEIEEERAAYEASKKQLAQSVMEERIRLKKELQSIKIMKSQVIIKQQQLATIHSMTASLPNS
jgi:hypothetical protein